MLRIEIQNIIEESIQNVVIEYIADKVIQKLVIKLEEENKKVLLVFTGATKGLKESLENLIKLKEDGFKFEIALSKPASNILNTELLKKLFETEKVYIDCNNIESHDLVKNNTIVIVPTLTSNTASKISNCIDDTMATNIINYALMTNKRVIASVDGTRPESRNISETQKSILRKNLESIKLYGVDTTTSNNLYHKVKNNSEHNINNVNNTKGISIESKSNIDNKNKYNIDKENEIYINKRIINRIDIYENRKYKNIKINKNSIVTDLANEEAIHLHINLIKI